MNNQDSNLNFHPSNPLLAVSNSNNVSVSEDTTEKDHQDSERRDTVVTVEMDVEDFG